MKNKILLIVMVVMLVWVLGGCSTTTDKVNNQKPVVEGVELNSSLKLGNTMQITVNASDKDNDELNYNFGSPNNEIVSQSGNTAEVKGTEIGTGEVTIKVSDGKGEVTTTREFEVTSLSDSEAITNVDYKEIMFIEDQQSIELSIASSIKDKVKNISYSSINGNTIEKTKDFGKAIYHSNGAIEDDTVTIQVETEDNVYTKEIQISIKDSLFINSINQSDVLFVNNSNGFSDTTNLTVDYISKETPQSIKWLKDGKVFAEGKTVEYTAANTPTSNEITVEIVTSNHNKSKNVSLTSNEIPDLVINDTMEKGTDNVLKVENVSNVENFVWNVSGVNSDTINYIPNDLGEEEIRVTLNYPEGSVKLNNRVTIYKTLSVTKNIQFKQKEINTDYTNFPDKYSDNQFQTYFTPSGHLWYHTMLGLDNLYKYNQTMLNNLETVRVATIDSGLKTSHPYIPEGKVNDTIASQFGDGDYSDSKGHGTFVAGTIFSPLNENNGVRGVAPNVELVPLEASIGSGSVSYGINFAVDNNVDIINMSLILWESTTELKNAVENAYDNNIIMNAALGNQGYDLDERTKELGDIITPAEYPETIAIGGLSKNYELYTTKGSGSNYGSNMSFSVPFRSAAPSIEGGYESRFGTSHATALMTGVTSLIKGKYLSLTVEEMRDLLKKYSWDLNTIGKDDKTGWGLPNVYPLMNEVLEKQVKTFVATKDNDVLTKVSEIHSESIAGFNNFSDSTSVNFEVKLESDANYQVVSWIDVNEDGSINAGDYLSIGDKKSLEVINQSYTLQ